MPKITQRDKIWSIKEIWKIFEQKYFLDPNYFQKGYNLWTFELAILKLESILFWLLLGSIGLNLLRCQLFWILGKVFYWNKALTWNHRFSLGGWVRPLKIVGLIGHISCNILSRSGNHTRNDFKEFQIHIKSKKFCIILKLYESSVCRKAQVYLLYLKSH